ncbi:DUF1573 domain-containing protein [Pelagicoccus mobilis]|uniref:DUF1573 domain-containing protein n=2 Tax=Pelagicoccus mobilis TaxID=415221 RepID=A0A934RWE5_9BACT|nr:DUF1573 domain-containing protein [Pelagicoccus mobilis]
MRLILGISLALATPFIALAENLNWTTQEQHFQADFDDTEIIANYAFTNTSQETVEIIETSATCGCTVPTLEKQSYAPGESGELKAVFTVGSRQGKQRKAITVATKDSAGAETTYELKLDIDIPVPVTFKPRVRFWKVSGEATTQEIEVTFHEQMPMSLAKLANKDPDEPTNFDYQIETLADGLKYKIKLTPKKPDKKSRTTYYLVSEQDEKNILRRYPIYAYVR